MLSGTGRLHLHGVLADTLRGAYGGGGGHSHHHHHFGSSLASARYMPKLPASRRGMRAPRMRWTSSLHARFVHAVELLGGHEREPLFLRSATHPPKPFLGNNLGSFHAGFAYFLAHCRRTSRHTYRGDSQVGA